MSTAQRRLHQIRLAEHPSRSLNPASRNPYAATDANFQTTHSPISRVPIPSAILQEQSLTIVLNTNANAYSGGGPGSGVQRHEKAPSFLHGWSQPALTLDGLELSASMVKVVRLIYEEYWFWLF